MLERVLARRKPVKADGRGYQDALIWESLLAEYPTDSNPVHFVTDNWTDFAAAAEGDELALELVEDLRSIGSTEKSVRLYRHLTQFTDIHVKPQREILGPRAAPTLPVDISEATKEKPGFWTRRRASEQVRSGSNIQLLSYSLVA
jgi:hypothetical protein